MGVYIVLSMVFSKQFNVDNSKYIFVSNRIIFRYDGNWKVTEAKRVLNKEFKNINIYNYMNDYETYNIIYDNNWYIINEDQKKIYNDDLFGISSNFDLSIYEFNVSKINKTEFDEIKKIIDLNDFQYNDLLINNKVIEDFDNDNQPEEIITLSNVFNNSSNKKYSLVLYKNNDEYKIINYYTMNQDTELDRQGQASIYKILKSENEYIIILKFDFFARPIDAIYSIYKIDNKGISKKLISN